MKGKKVHIHEQTRPRSSQIKQHKNALDPSYRKHGDDSVKTAGPYKCTVVVPISSFGEDEWHLREMKHDLDHRENDMYWGAQQSVRERTRAEGATQPARGRTMGIEHH